MVSIGTFRIRHRAHKRGRIVIKVATVAKYHFYLSSRHFSVVISTQKIDVERLPIRLLCPSCQLRFFQVIIGLIFSVGGGGALLGSLLAPWMRAHVAVGHLIVGVLTIMALATALLAFAPSPALAMVGWASISLIGPVYSVTVLSYRLGLVPDALQGRVTSVFRLLNMAGQPLSLAAGGLLLARLGPRPVLFLIATGGVLPIVVAIKGLRQA